MEFEEVIVDEEEQKEDFLVTCVRCKGTGKIINSDKDIQYADFICPKCLGFKKLNWIENIIGKKRPDLKVIYDFIESIDTSYYYPKFIDKLGEDLKNSIDEEIINTLKESKV